MAKEPPPKPADPAMAASMAAFGQNVHASRKNANLSKKEVARRARLAPAYIWRVEEGRQNIQLHSIAKIAGAIGVTMAELFAGVPSIEPPADETPEPKRQTNKV